MARFDLNGEPAGTVSENDAKIAQARLAGIRKAKQSREAEAQASGTNTRSKARTATTRWPGGAA